MGVRAALSGVGVVLQELDDVAQPMSQLRGAAHVGEHAEEVRVRDPLAANVGKQVGVVGRLAQDDFGVVRVEVHLEGGEERMWPLLQP